MEVGRADLGARVTGEARPLWNSAASSVEILSAVDDRSSLCGKGGRCKEESDMADGRRPWGTDVVGEVVGGVWVPVEGNSGDDSGPEAEPEEAGTGGRGIRVDVGDPEVDFDRVRVEIDAVLASAIRCCSHATSRCKTEMARSW